MPATVYLVTGGARSGKSRYAESLCQELSDAPIYLATATAMTGDDDFQQRIAKHQQDRQQPQQQNVRRDGRKCQWTTIEESLHPSKHMDQFTGGHVVLVDCMTLWLTNWMMEEGAFTVMGATTAADSSNNTSSTAHHDGDKEAQQQTSAAVERAMKKLQEEFERMIGPYDITYVIVTNEVGSGTHANTHLTRKFVDAQGWCNQFVAAKAYQVIHMVCGMPHIVKQQQDNNQHHHYQHGSTAAARYLEAQRLDRHLASRGMPMDANGYFLVKTDPNEGLIVVSFHSCIQNDKGEICDLDGNRISCHGASPDPMQVWKCRTAKEATTQIFEQWDQIHKLQLSVGHAAYIGREVQKAEFSLYHPGASKYQQD